MKLGGEGSGEDLGVGGKKKKRTLLTILYRKNK